MTGLTWNKHTLQRANKHNLHGSEPRIPQLIALLNRKTQLGRKHQQEETRADQLQNACQIRKSLLQAETGFVDRGEENDVAAVDDRGGELDAERDGGEDKCKTEDCAALERGSCGEDDADLEEET